MNSSLVVQFMLGSELMGLAVSDYGYHNHSNDDPINRHKPNKSVEATPLRSVPHL
jgi:hypothetical protein